MKKIKRRSECGISSTLDILGDKWSLLIIRDILFRGKSTYGEFLNAGEGIATNILADRLSMLEAEGFLTKSGHPDHKNQYIYSLTPKGIDLLPILCEFLLWSDKYMTISERGRNLAVKIREDRSGLIKQISENLQRNS